MRLGIGCGLHDLGLRRAPARAITDILGETVSAKRVISCRYDAQSDDRSCGKVGVACRGCTASTNIVPRNRIIKPLEKLEQGGFCRRRTVRRCATVSRRFDDRNVDTLFSDALIGPADRDNKMKRF